MFQNDSKEKCTEYVMELGSNEGELQPPGGGVLNSDDTVTPPYSSSWRIWWWNCNNL